MLTLMLYGMEIRDMADTKSPWHNARIAKLKEKVNYMNAVEHDVDNLLDFLKYIERVHHINVGDLFKEYDWDLETGYWKGK